MTNESKNQCKKCGRTSDIVDMNNCPFCHSQDSSLGGVSISGVTGCKHGRIFPPWGTGCVECSPTEKDPVEKHFNECPMNEFFGDKDKPCTCPAENVQSWQENLAKDPLTAPAIPFIKSLLAQALASERTKLREKIKNLKPISEVDYTVEYRVCREQVLDLLK